MKTTLLKLFNHITTLLEANYYYAQHLSVSDHYSSFKPCQCLQLNQGNKSRANEDQT